MAGEIHRGIKGSKRMNNPCFGKRVEGRLGPRR